MEKKPYSDSRWRDNPCPIMTQCGKCRHFKRGTISCKAFTEIPNDILANYEIHDHPIDGDQGFQFEPIDPSAPRPVQRKKAMPYD